MRDTLKYSRTEHSTSKTKISGCNSSPRSSCFCRSERYPKKRAQQFPVKPLGFFSLALTKGLRGRGENGEKPGGETEWGEKGRRRPWKGLPSAPPPGQGDHPRFPPAARAQAAGTARAWVVAASPQGRAASPGGGSPVRCRKSPSARAPLRAVCAVRTHSPPAPMAPGRAGGARRRGRARRVAARRGDRARCTPQRGPGWPGPPRGAGAGADPSESASPSGNRVFFPPCLAAARGPLPSLMPPAVFCPARWPSPGERPVLQPPITACPLTLSAPGRQPFLILVGIVRSAGLR